MAQEIQLIGIDRLIRRLEGVSESKVKQVVRKNGAELTRKMSDKAVFTKGYATGQTQQSIRLDMKDGGMTAEVGPHTDYAIYLEYGTRFMSAQPFVRPSLQEQAPTFIRDLENLLK